MQRELTPSGQTSSHDQKIVSALLFNNASKTASTTNKPFNLTQDLKDLSFSQTQFQNRSYSQLNIGQQKVKTNLDHKLMNTNMAHFSKNEGASMISNHPAPVLQSQHQNYIMRSNAQFSIPVGQNSTKQHKMIPTDNKLNQSVQSVSNLQSKINSNTQKLMNIYSGGS